MRHWTLAPPLTAGSNLHCRTAASAMDASLARGLVLAGVPAAIGMQGDFPDPLSDDLAASLYDFLLAGHPLAEAVRQALGGPPAEHDTRFAG